MHCIEVPRALIPFAFVLLLSGCAAPSGERADRPVTAPASTAMPGATAEALPAAAAARYLKLPPPPAVHSMDEVKVLAAMRMVAAHPDTSYGGKPPEPLLAIPVLEIELRADGSVRDIQVLREPRQAKDTIQLAIDIVRRAAPYGDVSRLKKPWKFVEVFLFDDDRRFKPAVLDQ